MPDHDTDVDRCETTRRRVLSATGCVGAIGTVGSGAGAPGGRDGDEAIDDARRGRQESRPLFDAHTHLVPEPVGDRDPLDADRLIEWMDRTGVDRAVVLPLESPEAYPVMAPTRWVLEEAAAYPDRLLPFCSIDPRTLHYGADVVADRLDRYVDRGARGFGELKPGLPVDDARLETVYELCADRGLPILFHADDTSMRDDPSFSALEEIVASYPEVDFLGHGQGWWARISADVAEADLGGYPDGPVEPGGPVPELLATHDNVYGELSGNSGWNALARDRAFGQRFLERHHEQLLFGTDYLYPGYPVPNFRLFETFDLGEAAWRNIRYRNLVDVLG